MAYWTKSEEDDPVYHIYDDCPNGEQIESKNREEGAVAPAGRNLCKSCKKKRDEGSF